MRAACATSATASARHVCSPIIGWDWRIVLLHRLLRCLLLHGACTLRDGAPCTRRAECGPCAPARRRHALAARALSGSAASCSGRHSSSSSAITITSTAAPRRRGLPHCRAAPVALAQSSTPFLASHASIAWATTHLPPLLAYLGVFMLCCAATAFLLCAIPTLWTLTRVAHRTEVILAQVSSQGLRHTQRAVQGRNGHMAGTTAGTCAPCPPAHTRLSARIHAPSHPLPVPCKLPIYRL